MSALDDFFGPAYNVVEEEAKCLICDKSSKMGDGEWVTTNLWVCGEHVAEYHQQKIGEQIEITEAKALIEAGQHTMVHLNAVVSAGLATFTYETGESERITGIEWTISGSKYVDQKD